jgi:hypothetical protein
VKITVADCTYRTTVFPRGGVFLVPLSAENRTAANVNAGDEVHVDIERHTVARCSDRGLPQI